MSRFHVGQRVRVVRVVNPYNENIVGREATLLWFGRDVIDPFTGAKFSGWALTIDGVGDTGPGGYQRYVREENIEPLTNPGQKEFTAEDVLTLEGLPDFKIPVRVAA